MGAYLADGYNPSTLSEFWEADSRGDTKSFWDRPEEGKKSTGNNTANACREKSSACFVCQ